MNFNPEHIRILEKNKSYYQSLQDNGTVSRLSSVIISEFQQVYKEAINDLTFHIWCKSCVVELIELCYINYYKFLENEARNNTDTNARPGSIKPTLPAPKNKRKVL